MSDEQGSGAGGRGIAGRFTAGGWYFVVVICSAGILAAVPFWHASARLQRPTVRRSAIAYSAAGVAVLVLSAIVPRDAAGEAVGGVGQALNGLFAMSALAVLIAACVQLRPLRREVFGLRPLPTSADPAVARVLAGRARREEARRLWERDPTMGRELGIGRPDLRRGYDDGGLVDVNTAPAAVLVAVCGFPPEAADRLVAAREVRLGGYLLPGEVFAEVDLPGHLQDQLRERAVF